MRLRSFAGEIVKAGSTTALGTSTTAITGLSLALPVGQWEFKAIIPIVNVGAPTDTQFTLSPSGGPTTSHLFYTITRYSASAGVSTVHTALNTASTGAVASCIICVISGYITSTGTGTLTVNGTRTGGTSQTVQANAYITAIPIG